MSQSHIIAALKQAAATESEQRAMLAVGDGRVALLNEVHLQRARVMMRAEGFCAAEFKTAANVFGQLSHICVLRKAHDGPHRHQEYPEDQTQ
jgi:hypothetical protein